MRKKYQIAFFILLALALWFLVFTEIPIVWPHFTFAVLQPKGIISQQQKSLLITATLLMLVVAIPVYFLLFFIVFKYRAEKENQNYSPNLDSKWGAALIWAIPGSVIFILAIINWKSTHALDPYKPIASSKPPITIQVVALQWKWLFIHPQQNIATVNFIEFPQNTPVSFELTADAPMNSFWIPQLGGQMYAMAGMKTQLHLMANQTGDFNGSDAE